MKIDNFKEIAEATKTIESGIETVLKNLNDLLSSPRYIFEIKYNRKDYKFIPSTTIEEKEQMDSHRNEFISKLLKNTINRNIKDKNYGWNDLMSFCTGLDSRDYEIIKVTESEYKPEVDENGERITAKPLDAFNIMAINQRMDITEKERKHLILEALKATDEQWLVEESARLGMSYDKQDKEMDKQ